jgi:tRNA (guanine-N7-)-methyltransferase
LGKNKLARWAEMKTFSNVIEPPTEEAYGRDHPLKGNWNRTIFRNENPIVLELGCGKGEYTVGLASKFHNNNYIGIDIKGARMWRGSKTAHENGISNAAFLRTRIEFINSFFSVDEVKEIWITFPDPHPKRRNASKRLTSPFFLNFYRSFLINRGIVHLKTDNKDLYEYTCNVARHNQLEIAASTSDLYSGAMNSEIHSIKTHYEKIFLKEGIKICYLSFYLDKNKALQDAIGKSHHKE